MQDFEMNRRISEQQAVNPSRSENLQKSLHQQHTSPTYQPEALVTPKTEANAKMVGAMSFRSRRDLTERGKSMDIVARVPQTQKNTFISRAQDIVLSQMSESQEDISAMGNSFVDYLSRQNTAKKDSAKEPVIIEWDQTADEKNGTKYNNRQ